jgi:histidine phosphotransferase ChpT
MQIDIRVLELLLSKTCHDLVSPVSAINNGVELIEDIGGSVVDEAMKLIGNSAGQASRRLRLFRMAYGRAGSEDAIPTKDVKQTAEQYISGGKVTLAWADELPGEALAQQKGYLKVMLNLVILAEEVLAYGGLVTVRPVTETDRLGVRFEIVGRGAQLTPQLLDAFEGVTAIEELTPRSIQAYITNRFATHFNLTLKHEQLIPDRLDLTLYGAAPVSLL